MTLVQFASDSLNDSLRGMVESNSAIVRARGHNLRFEERVADARLDRYEALISGGRRITPTDFGAEHVGYVRNHIEVSAGRIADTFSARNSRAILEDIAEQPLVRLELLGRLISNTLGPMAANIATFLHWFRVAQSGAAEAGVTPDDATRALDNLMRQWDWSRDARPSFAAFYDELRDDIEGDGDWLVKIRNRLGLAHYNVPAGAPPIPVALMRYTVADVLKELPAEERRRAFALPTVLDGPPNEYFFPSPSELDFGRCICLIPDDSGDSIVSEILHRRIRYGLKHLYRIGVLNSPRPAFSIRELRNQHLWWMRIESDREGFGEEIPEGLAE